MIGPDAWRYLALARGEKVVRPFHLRWLLPKVCGQSMREWAVARWSGFALAFAGCVLVLPGWRGVAAGCLLLGLSGVVGHPATNPVGVDVPALGLGVAAWGLIEHDLWLPALVVLVVAAATKESAPVWVALWAWHPLPLAALVVVAIRAMVAKPGVDALTMSYGNLAEIHDHPFRTALAAHRGQWRDAWVMVAPWGACLAGLYGAGWPIAAVLVVAHLQLLIATDTARLLHTAAGPALAVAAAATIPVAWLPLAVAVHVAWWRPPVLI